MDELRTLQDLHREPALFHFSPSFGWGKSANIYAFVGQLVGRAGAEGPWDLIRVTHLNTPPLLYELKLVHVEEEELESPDFDVERDGGGSVTLTPPQLEALVRLLRVLGGEYLAREQVETYFIPLAEEDLVKLGFPHEFVQMTRGDHLRSFQYMEDRRVQNQAEMQLVWASGWTTRSAQSATMYLEFATYDAERLNRIKRAFAQDQDSEGHPSSLDLTLLEGTGALQLSQPALSALSTLLEWHHFPLQGT
jgi:hypothetical protein